MANTYKNFSLSTEELNEITEEIDDTAGFLIKMSTLKYLIEKYVDKENHGLQQHLQKVKNHNENLRTINQELLQENEQLQKQIKELKNT